MFTPLIGTPGWPELLLILAVVILIFGAAKLPDLARSSGQALRIFKAETKGLRDGDKKDTVEGQVVNDDKPEETR
ncbi:twin-arginine translocase TatA/TatE family subunit [Nocardioides sp.]|jgi:sec-independent protein translocase protein TatA|uniref:twin-arginine translocase TatA/TatE family subunit n=1 Tax=Nocardioides sp. TaxID=35761 RepID=UPI000D30627E|nr:twin-arginine translocase TatA/TatE family subunit [Nocardioides sp.]HSX67956.1 twin-arginine translocase TatA/TatE family subunit [Nocardioides sp.]